MGPAGASRDPDVVLIRRCCRSARRQPGWKAARHLKNGRLTIFKRSQDAGSARLSLHACPEEFSQILFAVLKLGNRQIPPEQLVAQPDPVGIDNVGLAIVGNRLNFSIEKQLSYPGAVDSVRLARQSHDPADLIKRRLRPRTER